MGYCKYLYMLANWAIASAIAHDEERSNTNRIVYPMLTENVSASDTLELEPWRSLPSGSLMLFDLRMNVV